MLHDIIGLRLADYFQFVPIPCPGWFKMFEDVSGLPGFNDHLDRICIVIDARNNRLARLSFPTEESMRPGPANQRVSVAHSHLKCDTKHGWPHHINAPLAGIFHRFGLVGEMHELLRRCAPRQKRHPKTDCEQLKESFHGW